MAERALNDLYAMMSDLRIGMRTRLNAAISASRVEPLSMPGEAPPPAVAFLRHIIDYKRDGVQYSSGWRREAAAALAYHERRAAKMLLTYQVPDQAESRRTWRGMINGCLRIELARRGLWPERKDVLLGAADQFDPRGGDPERTMAALLLPATSHSSARRQRAIDDPGQFAPASSEAERIALINPIARIVEARLAEFGL